MANAINPRHLQYHQQTNKPTNERMDKQNDVTIA